MMKATAALLLAMVLMLTTTSVVRAQIYGQRLQSLDGQWLLPVATRLLCSDTNDHVGRGSIPSWDLCTPAGAPIYAAAPGRVILAGCGNEGGYGCWVKLDHGAGITSAYAHMVAGSIAVSVGQQVDHNTVLGAVGWTGQTSFGPHVHFVIYRKGQHVDPATIFSRTAMQYCKLCSSPDGDATPRGTLNGHPTALTGSTLQQTVLERIPGALAILGPERAATLATAIFVVLCVVWWLGGLYVRVSIVAGVVGVSAAVTVVLVLMPTPATASQPALTGNAAWEQVYPILQRNEGWDCTEDGAHTMGGITQGTYNRWRRLHGAPPADVCQALTRAQAKTIYYELFWLGSGADKLPAALALTVTDHYINTGTYSAGLQQCGYDVRCFNQWRVADYRTKSNFYLYGQAWINRVNRIRSITEAP